MKPVHSVLIWLAELSFLSILYCIFCYFTPDLELYDWYVEKYGFVIEEDFLDYYTLILYLIAIAVTTACIWLIAIIRTKRYWLAHCERNKKTALRGGFTTLLIALIILCFPWYPEWDLNPHSANAEGF